MSTRAGVPHSLHARQVPRDAAQPVSAANPLFAQLNAFGTTVGWAQTT